MLGTNIIVRPPITYATKAVMYVNRWAEVNGCSAGMDNIFFMWSIAEKRNVMKVQDFSVLLENNESGGSCQQI